MSEVGNGYHTEELFTSEQDTIAKAEDILKRVGLTSNALNGKRVLDVGASECYLERALRNKHSAATVISYEISKDRLLSTMSNDSQRVVGDAVDGFPFQTDSYDMIIDSAGPISNIDEDDLYADAVRVLRTNGELRVSVPFLQTILYNLYEQSKEKAKHGELPVPKEEIDRFVENQCTYYAEENDVELSGDEKAELKKDLVDEYGLPIQKHFWDHIVYSQNFSFEEQKKLYEAQRGMLLEDLKARGYDVAIELVEDKQHMAFGKRKYLPYLVVQKK